MTRRGASEQVCGWTDGRGGWIGGMGLPDDREDGSGMGEEEEQVCRAKGLAGGRTHEANRLAGRT
jgi:hypothetical protein